MLEFLQSPLGEDPVVSQAVLPVAPDRIFRAWTDPEEIKSWFGQEPYSVQHAEIDLQVGGKWLFVFDTSRESHNSLSGEYLEIVPNSRLAFTWCHKRVGNDGVLQTSPISKVLVTIESDGPSTVLTVNHRDTATEDTRQNVSVGWERSLQSLTKKLASLSEG